MSRAVGRRSVPLKNMCSAKCAMPLSSRRSYREPAANITKHETDWACAIGAVSSRVPLARVARSKVVTHPWYRGGVGHRLGHVQALALVGRVLVDAAELGPVSVVVTDTHGEVVVAVRMDGAALDTELNARRKAY